LRPRHVNVVRVDGVDIAAVTAQLKQAYGRLRGIDAAARNIAVSEFGERLTRITDIGRDILAENRTRSAHDRAPGVFEPISRQCGKVTTQYAQNASASCAAVRSSRISGSCSSTWSRTLPISAKTAGERRSLDVDIEVLNARLKRDGIS
jgi:hypothetical protein